MSSQSLSCSHSEQTYKKKVSSIHSQKHEVDLVPNKETDPTKIIDIDPHLEKYVEEFITVNEYEEVRQKACLIITASGSPQEEFCNYLVCKYTNIGLVAFFHKKFFVYHPSFGAEPINIDGNFSSKVMKASFSNSEGHDVFFHHFYDKLSVGAIMTLFQNKAETIKRVVCVSGVKVKGSCYRKINFSSNVNPSNGSERLQVKSMCDCSCKGIISLKTK